MKRYVADTHAVLWFAAGELRRLGCRARRVFSEIGTGRCEILVSVVSLWEIAILHDEGAIRLPAGFSAWCDGLAAVAGVRIEPLTRSDVEEARSLRGLRDPHDRLIAGSALRLGAALLTVDRRMRGDRRLRTIW
jgi:PIN domain nuclease of toxin-antitoxin system